MTAGRPEDSTLRAKYLDWCSARIADRFLALSPEDIYRLARERDSGDVGDDGEPDVQPAEPDAGAADVAIEEDPEADALPFGALVERVTEALRRRLKLPDFSEWAADYEADPERYDRELLGFWKGEVEST